MTSLHPSFHLFSLLNHECFPLHYRLGNEHYSNQLEMLKCPFYDLYDYYLKSSKQSEETGFKKPLYFLAKRGFAITMVSPFKTFIIIIPAWTNWFSHDAALCDSKWCISPFLFFFLSRHRFRWKHIMLMQTCLLKFGTWTKCMYMPKCHAWRWFFNTRD